MKGRPILGVISGFLFGLLLGVTLFLFGALPLSSPWLLILRRIRIGWAIGRRPAFVEWRNHILLDRGPGRLCRCCLRWLGRLTASKGRPRGHDEAQHDAQHREDQQPRRVQG